MIKPIETKYKGYCFRSRLEARWAVFFDALGVEWQYEQEGLDLTDAYQKRVDFKPLDPGQRVLYLPDFYLPQQRKYVEIKPYGGANWWGDGYPLLYEKIVLLGGLLVHGVPGTIDDRTYEICVEGDTDYYFGYCPHCHAFGAGYCSWADLNKRTLTNLYNERPAWLDAAHKRLDAAVFDAYGWPHDLSDEEILARLLALNLERAGQLTGPTIAE